MRRALVEAALWIVPVVLFPVAVVVWLVAILAEVWYDVRAWGRS